MDIRVPVQKRLSAAVLLFPALALSLLAQNGSPDPDFITGTGPNNYVNATAVQADGRILIGGAFTTVNGASLVRIARLNPNGSVDPGFTPGSGVNDDVRVIAVQPDGRIVIAGDFMTVYGAPRQRIARLMPNGTVDYTFALPGGSSANAQVYDVAIQPDGRIVVVGAFTELAGAAVNRILRLNADGSVNNSFDPGTGANNIIRAVALQSDGKIVIGGDFTTYNGLARNRIARLNPDGSLDGTFNPGTGFNNGSSVYDLALDASGGIYVAGSFTSFNGKAQKGLTRLTSTGTLDALFDMTVGFNNSVVSIALQPSGQILAGGLFTSVNTITRARIARINTDASVDLLFDPGSGANLTVRAVTALPAGDVVIGGDFTSVAGQATRKYVTQLLADGGGAGSAPQIVSAPVESKTHAGYTAEFSVVATGSPALNYQWKFKGANLPAGTNSTLLLPNVTADQAGDYTVSVSNAAGGPVTATASLIVLPAAPASGSLDVDFSTAQGPNNAVIALALQTDGRILIGGQFTTVDGQNRGRVARLRTNGSVDPTFAPLSGTSGDVRTLVLQGDEKILIGGDFITYNGAPRQRIARLNNDGTLDATFLPGQAANNTVDTIAVQADGKILLGGLFTTFAGETRNRIARLNADGSLDATFNPTGGANGRVRSILVLPSGKIAVGGEFTTFAGVGRSRITRLNSDGSLDETFDVGTGFNNSVYRLILFRNSVLASGEFTTYNGTPAGRLALLGANGSLSPEFDTSTGFNNYPYDLDVDPDGNVVAAGAFTTANNLTRNRVARLFGADASIDTSFDPGAGANASVWAIAAQPDGKVVIGGAFTTVGGQNRKFIARLNSDPQPLPPAFSLAIRNTDDGVRVDVFAERGFNYTIQRSADLIQWQNWTNITGAGLESEVRLLDPSSKTTPAGFYRGIFP